MGKNKKYWGCALCLCACAQNFMLDVCVFVGRCFVMVRAPTKLRVLGGGWLFPTLSGVRNVLWVFVKWFAGRFAVVVPNLFGLDVCVCVPVCVCVG